MKIIPATITKQHDVIVPAVIKEKNHVIVPAQIHSSNINMVRDFLYRSKNIIEKDLDLESVSQYIQLEFIHDESLPLIDVKSYPHDNDIYNIFVIYINMYHITSIRFDIYDSFNDIFVRFAKTMRGIYQYINIFAYGSDEFEFEYGSCDEDVLVYDAEKYTKELVNSLKEEDIIDNLIGFVILSNASTIDYSFDAIRWVYTVVDHSEALQTILNELPIMVSYCNWYMNDNYTMYTLDFNSDLDTCIIKFNCNTLLPKTIHGVIQYTENLIISSLLDLLNELSIDVTGIPDIEYISYKLRSEIRSLF